MSKKQIGVAGKNVYTGIDVHKRTYSICAIVEGTIVKKATVPASPEGLVAFLKKCFEGARIFSVYEAGFSGFGLHRALVESGVINIVVNAASIEVAANDKKKTDSRDSQKMAEQLSAGRLKAIYIPSEEEELRRQVTRTREQITNERTRTANQIKSKMFYFGLIKNDEDTVVSEKYLKAVEARELPAELRFCLGLLIKTWRHLSVQLEEIKTEMMGQSFEDAANEEVYRSVPGVGPVGARVLSNELGNLATRFSNQKALFQFTGLTPAEYSSGDHVRKGNIDRQGSPRVRKILVEASWFAIAQDGALKECFDRIAHTRGKKRAIVAIARKLIGRIRACFVQGGPYCVGICE